VIRVYEHHITNRGTKAQRKTPVIFLYKRFTLIALSASEILNKDITGGLTISFFKINLTSGSVINNAIFLVKKTKDSFLFV